MTQAESMKQENWTDFPTYAYNIFNSDFVHNHLCHLKFKARSDKSLADIRIAAKKKDNGVEVGHEAKILWSFDQDKAVCMRFKSNGYFKVHYDNGTIERGGVKVNLYGSVNSSKAF